MIALLYGRIDNGLGSTMATTDSSGNVINTYAHAATISSTGSQPNPCQFAGQQTGPTGLQYLRARYYDPASGTFLLQDPMDVSPAWPGNPFGYADGNPATLVDPYGLFWDSRVEPGQAQCERSSKLCR